MGDPTPTRETDTAATIEITTPSEFDDVIETEDRVLVDFYADWCGPCQMMAPILDEFAAETDVVVVKVNVETAPAIAARFDVQSIPTVITFHQGEPEQRLIGLAEKETLEDAINT